MKSLGKSIYSIAKLPTIIPQVMLFFTSSSRIIIEKDLERWTGRQTSGYTLFKDFIKIMTFYPEFCSLFYYRIESEHFIVAHLLKYLCPGRTNLIIETPHIGPGLFIQHGWSTGIGAKSIGSNCWINQGVLIGYSEKNERPTIEDNVYIYAGAKVLGGITIGSYSKIGANAVVVKDVPKNCTVVGIPAYIVKRNGLPTRERL
jgi:serine O-acetyltransferase